MTELYFIMVQMAYLHLCILPKSVRTVPNFPFVIENKSSNILKSEDPRPLQIYEKTFSVLKALTTAPHGLAWRGDWAISEINLLLDLCNGVACSVIERPQYLERILPYFSPFELKETEISEIGKRSLNSNLFSPAQVKAWSFFEGCSNGSLGRAMSYSPYQSEGGGR